ncbi:MAG: cation:proton antiporter [Methanobacteriaceae archaeon]|nr:cation:proton antiporter [Methanobacteriaceae archaeon]
MALFFLKDIVLILFMAVLVLLIFNKIKLPPIIAFFISGILLGPYGLHFVNSVSQIEVISELGIIFLLFIIGLEFSVEKFSAIKHFALIGGVLQLIFTTAVSSIIAIFVGIPMNQALFLGFLVCFSSTAIVLRILEEKHQLDSIQGRTILGILIFQDVAAVLILLFTPMLAGSMEVDVFTLLRNVVLLIIFLIIIGKWIIPKLLTITAQFKNRDLFILVILLICLGTTYITSWVGLSEALGAFLAGLLISNTHYRHQALGLMQPFQDVFMSLFLISVGMMINVNFLINNALMIIFLALMVIIIKIIITFGVTIILKLPMKIMIIVSVLLSQIGEFSFVLAAAGLGVGLLNEYLFQMFLAVTIITMSLTPFLANLLPKVIDKFNHVELPNFLDNANNIEVPKEIELRNHVIIVGYGINGKNLAASCEKFDIPYVIVDLNPKIVNQGLKKGKHIFYGDATKENILEELNINDAKLMVIATSSSKGAIRITDISKKLNPNIYIIVRTRYIKFIDAIFEAGADEVIPEEFETSIEIFSRVLDEYDQDEKEIMEHVAELRSNHYDTFDTNDSNILSSLNFTKTDLDVDSIIISKETTLGKLNLSKYNLKPIAIMHGMDTINNFDDTYELSLEDVVLVSGFPEDIDKYYECN